MSNAFTLLQKHLDLTPDKLLRQDQTSIMGDLTSWIVLKMEQRMTHHPPLSLGPRKLFRIDARTGIDVTCALKCDRDFHLGALLLFWGYVAVIFSSRHSGERHCKHCGVDRRRLLKEEDRPTFGGLRSVLTRELNLASLKLFDALSKVYA